MILASEKEYRAHPALNYSKLQEFNLNRSAYYKKHVLGYVEKTLNQSMILGSLVDCMLLTPELIESQFKVANCDKPQGQMGLFLDELYLTLLSFTDSSGEVKESVPNLIKYAFDKFKENNPEKFKNKDITFILDSFNKPGKDGIVPRDYFMECIAGYGKMVVDQKLYSRAEKICDFIKYGKYTRFLFEPSRNTEVLFQKGIVGELDGTAVKGLLDIVVIDHSRKTIKGIDLKCVWDPESFNISFLKRGYYLQASLYHYLLSELANNMNLEGYTIENFEFLVCDTTLENLPHFYIVPEDIIKKGLFDTIQDRYQNKYRSVSYLIAELVFCHRIGFNDSLELDSSNGKIQITI